MDRVFSGKWLIQFDSGLYTRESVFYTLPWIEDWLDSRGFKKQLRRIQFDPGNACNTFHADDLNIHIQLSNPYSQCINEISGKGAESRNIAINSLIQNKSVTLVCPFMASDKRWDTIGIPSSAFFLASALQQKKFRVNVKKVELPLHYQPFDLTNSHVLGVTLFEDLYVETKKMLERFKKTMAFDAIFAAGGPMVTLHPLEVAFHTPELNLLIRGEAELVFPEILSRITAGNIQSLFDFEGLFFQLPGLMLFSDLQRINRPEDLGSISFNLDFLQPDDLRHGLEINLSRGCKRTCIFCSQVQGKKIRQLPVESFSRLLGEYRSAIGAHNLADPFRYSININDDDILQDETYTRSILQAVSEHKMPLWGIQASLQAFFDRKGAVRESLLQLLSEKDLFVNRQPLLWLGTDAFLAKRGQRLAKIIPPQNRITGLMEKLEMYGISHYHYWICSDPDTGWAEFIEEFEIIVQLLDRFPAFHLLPHSPFIVPYPSTPLYNWLLKTGREKQIVLSQSLPSEQPIYALPLVKQALTPHPLLNRMLSNEILPGRRGFFDYLKQGELVECWKNIFYFLKEQRLQMINAANKSKIDAMIKLEARLETTISASIS